MSLNLISEHACFGGSVRFYSHESRECRTEMRFSVYLPPQAKNGKVPVLYYLAGLTCTEETFTVKAGAQRVAAELGLMLVAPDTSPRKVRHPGDDASWDFGLAAGFYVDSLQEPWAQNYRMYSYVTRELPEVVQSLGAGDADRQGIFGHSMGGHGALVCALRNPTQYKSVSAFAPISSPSQVPWGQKAFTGYLGEDRALWKQYDANELIRSQRYARPILIDQGDKDKFLVEQLKPELFAAAAKESGSEVQTRIQPGYDHGYYFIATFMEDHLRHHARQLSSA
ncbi:S-formylglutathione hydrolase [Steroidobacter sp.]|uniref:S-formylglutathione hydrolase n=1 Tax=Steroidobacter sp. TaxID=1978227 RepID=UPI001A611090|nr:S-formylglutathione hydrolase [Steroidobacter sp.]MBL8267181.1 S-formylglutathione hydrolase [Steroidobacter sp.]